MPRRYIPPCERYDFVGTLTQCWTRKSGEPGYLGPMVFPSPNGNGLGMVGRPHIIFNTPTQSIKGTYLFNSRSDQLNIAVGCESGYDTDEYGDPTTGVQMHLWTNGSITFRIRPSLSEHEVLFRIVLPMRPTEGSRFRFDVQLQTEWENCVSFRVVELLEGDVDGYDTGPVVISVPASRRPNNCNGVAAIYNCERGRYSTLESLVVDGLNMMPSVLELLTSGNRSQYGIITQQEEENDNFDLHIDIHPGLKNFTTVCPLEYERRRRERAILLIRT